MKGNKKTVFDLIYEHKLTGKKERKKERKKESCEMCSE